MIVKYSGYKSKDYDEDLLLSVQSKSGSTYKGASSGAPTLPKISSLERASTVGNPSVYTPKQTTLPKRTVTVGPKQWSRETATNNLTTKAPTVSTPSKFTSALEKASVASDLTPTTREMNRSNNFLKGVGTSFAATIPTLIDTTKQSLSDWQDKVRQEGLRKSLTEMSMNMDNPNWTYGKPVSTDSTGYRLYQKANDYFQKAQSGLNPAQQQAMGIAASLAQNAVTLPTAFINPSAPLIIMGANAAANRANELTAQGKTATEALGRAGLSGAIEVMTEKIPLERIINIAKIGGKSALKNILTGYGIEGSEELLSYIMNYAADVSAGDETANFSLGDALLTFFMGGAAGAITSGAATAIGSMPSYRQMVADNITYNGILPRGNANYSSDISNADINVTRNYPDGTTSTLPISQYLDEYSKGKQYAKDITNNNTLALPKPSDYYTTSEGILTQRPIETWNTPQKYETVYDNFETIEFKPSGEFEIDDGSLSKRDVSAYNFVKSKADELNTTTKKVYDAYKKSRDGLFNKVVDEWFDAYKNYKPQGTQMVISNNEQIGGVPVDRYTRISNNESWYREAYAIYGHKPNQSQLRQFVERKVIDDINSGRGEYLDASTARTIRTYDNLLEGYNKVTSNGEKNVLDIRLNENGNYEVDYGTPREQIVNDPTKFYQGRMVLQENVLPDTTNAQQMPKRNIMQANFNVMEGNTLITKQGFTDGVYNYYKDGKDWITVDPVTGVKQSNKNKTLVEAMNYIDKKTKSNNSNAITEDISSQEKTIESNTAAMNMRRNSDSLSIKPDNNKTILNKNISANDLQNIISKSNFSNLSESTPNAQYKGDSISRFKESMQTQNVYGDEFKSRVIDNDNINTYYRMSNEETFNMASERLKTNGAEEASRWLNINPKEASAVDEAEGMILAKQYEQSGNYEGMVNVIEHLRKMGTSAGRSTQIFAALQRMTPEGMAYYAQKSLDNAYNELSKGKTKKWIDENSDKFKLTEDDIKFITENMEKVSKTNNQREKDILIAEIQARMSEKVPATTRERLNTLARISMLFNLKTQIRNVLGNVVVIPRTVASDVIGTGIDKALSKKSGIRTTGTFDISSVKGMKKGISEAYYDYRHGINTRDVQDGRFELRNTSAFKGNNILSKGVKTIDDLTSFMLDAGDRGFWQMWYDNSLSNQMALNNVTEATQEMKDIAAIEAAERTWQDNNGYTDFVSNIKRGLNKINFKGYGLGDVMMPFVKTPANLVKAVVDYSPVGVLNALVKDSKNLKSAIDTGKNVSVAQRRYVNDLSKGITGTLLMALYGVLANKEIIKGDAADDKDVRNFERNILGMLPYSIKIGDKTYSYEWAQPVGGTMAVVANALEGYKTSKEQGDSGYLNIFNAIYSGAQAMGTTLFNLSFMDGLKSLFDSDDFIQGVVDAIGAEPAKFLPTLVGQLAQTMDEYNRTTYVSGNPLKTNINKVLTKIPGARETLPATVDVLGREVEGNNSIFDAFINPVNYSKENTSASANEIYNIYRETGNKAVIPPTAPYSITSKNKEYNLSPEETAAYQKTTGSIINSGVEDLLNNPDYNNMPVEDKAEVLTDLYAYAQEKAKAEAIDGFEISNVSKEADEAAQKGLSEADYYLYKYYLNKKDENGNSLKSEEKREILKNNTTLSAQEKNMLDDLLIDDFTFIPKDVSVDYSSDESFVVSQMSSGEKEKYSLVQGILPAESYSYLYDVIGGLESDVDYPKGERSPFVKSLIDTYLEQYGYNPTYSERMKIYESYNVAKEYRY